MSRGPLSVVRGLVGRRRLGALLAACAVALGGGLTRPPAESAAASSLALVLARYDQSGTVLFTADPGVSTPREVGRIPASPASGGEGRAGCVAAPPQSAVCARGDDVVVYDLVADSLQTAYEPKPDQFTQRAYRLYRAAEGAVYALEIVSFRDARTQHWRLFRVTPSPVLLVEPVAAGEHEPPPAIGGFAGDSATAGLYYMLPPTGNAAWSELYAHDRSTGERQWTRQIEAYSGIRVSPDGRRAIAGSLRGWGGKANKEGYPDTAFWLYDLTGTAPLPTGIDVGDGEAFDGVLWRPDGDALLTSVDITAEAGWSATGRRTIWRYRSAAGALTKGPQYTGASRPVDVSADGTAIALSGWDGFGASPPSLITVATGRRLALSPRNDDEVVGWLMVR